MTSHDKHILLIVNPISGTLPKEGLLARVQRKLEPEGFDVEEVRTERAGHASELAAKAAAEGCYGVVVAGGDGTVNEVASALRGSRTALGILPFGSGNGLARHLYGSIDVDRALDVIALDNASDCDYGTVNGHPFFCTFGLGFDAKVSQEFSSMSRRGLVSYVRSAMQEWVHYVPAEYEIRIGRNTIKMKAFLVAVCNASQYGNSAFIAPKASVHDGYLDITIIHAGNPLTVAFAGMELFTGRIDKNFLIQTFRVKEAEIRHVPAPGHIDGDPCNMPETMHVKCHEGDIRMFTDPEKPPFRPFITLLEAARKDGRFMIREIARIVTIKIKGFFRGLKKMIRGKSAKNISKKEPD